MPVASLVFDRNNDAWILSAAGDPSAAVSTPGVFPLNSPCGPRRHRPTSNQLSCCTEITPAYSPVSQLQVHSNFLRTMNGCPRTLRTDRFHVASGSGVRPSTRWDGAFEPSSTQAASFRTGFARDLIEVTLCNTTGETTPVSAACLLGLRQHASLKRARSGPTNAAESTSWLSSASLRFKRDIGSRGYQ